MGSPLAPTFAEFYMCNLENQVLTNNKPDIYCRYVDDIYVVIDSENQLQELQRTMKEQSVLKFTYALSNNNSMPFLDVNVSVVGNSYLTTVYRKETDSGHCLNPISECPDRYKRSVIRGYLHRAHKTCSTPGLLKAELERVKQILINHGYSNTVVDSEISKFHITSPDSEASFINVYYENQMSAAYKVDERVMHSIINNNVKSIQEDQQVKLIIYYRNNKTRQLVVKNNMRPRVGLQKANVVYKISCPKEDCVPLNNVSYVGMTATTLTRRLTCHLAAGAPKDHFRMYHGEALTRQLLEDNVKILDRYRDHYRLGIAEALYINKLHPSINLQSAGFQRTLKVFS